jgi:hypothetical protein
MYFVKRIARRIGQTVASLYFAIAIAVWISWILCLREEGILAFLFYGIWKGLVDGILWPFHLAHWLLF